SLPLGWSIHHCCHSSCCCSAVCTCSCCPMPPTARSMRADRSGRMAKTPGQSTKASAAPVLLSGGNPQIAKGDGDTPVQAYIAAMPAWKRDVGRRLDALIVRTVPGVRKAVKWNTPFYGIEGPDGEPAWFLGFHCLTKYVKVAF